MNVDGTTLGIQVLMFIASMVAVGLVDRHLTARAREPKGRHVGSESVPTRLRHAGAIVLVAGWFGLATGVFHLLLAFITRYLRGHFVMVGPAIIWMAPVAYVTTFAALGAVIGAVAFVNSRLVPMRLAFGGFIWLGVFALFLPFVQIHRLAAAILAAGIATQMAGIMGRHPSAWMAIMRRSGAVAVGGIVLLSLGLHGWGRWNERRAIAGLGPAGVGAPNILLLVLDTVRAVNLSLYGYDRPTTPELEGLAREGVTFDLAFSTGPWTLKSHATMFTGLYPSQTVGDFVRPVRTDAPVLAELLRERGYMTGGFVGNLPYTSYESGLNKGFIHYDDYRVRRQQILRHSWIAQTPLYQEIAEGFASGSPRLAQWHVRNALRNFSLKFEPDMFNSFTYGRRPAGEIADAFLDWQATIGERPFFGFLNFFDAHAGYIAPPEYLAQFALEGKRTLGRYDGAIAYVDHEIGRLLDELQRRGVLDNTLVIITADHGEQFGEHGLVAHANSLYSSLLHVPLIIRYPARVPEGLRISTPVTLRDLAATIVDLAGVQLEAPLPGTSLAGGWDDTRAWDRSPIVASVEEAVRPPPETPVRFGPMSSVYDDRFHYILRGDGFEELYAYRVDGSETVNLANSREGRSELPRLRKLLASVKSP